MLQVTQSIDSGYTVYKFNANNTDYDVLTTDGVEFTVYSQRAHMQHVSPPTVYGSLGEMAKRSKALNHLTQLIEA